MRGIIIENSLMDKSILSKMQITRTWSEDDWLLDQVETDEATAQSVGSYMHDGWYAHFWTPGESKILVVFKKKSFTIDSLNKSTWGDCVYYGKSLGIPEEQLDFKIY